MHGRRGLKVESEIDGRCHAFKKIVKIHSGLEDEVVLRQLSMAKEKPVAVLFKKISVPPYQPSERNRGGECDDMGVLVFPFPADLDCQKFIPVRLKMSLCVGLKKKDRLPEKGK